MSSPVATPRWRRTVVLALIIALIRFMLEIRRAEKASRQAEQQTAAAAAAAAAELKTSAPN